LDVAAFTTVTFSASSGSYYHEGPFIAHRRSLMQDIQKLVDRSREGDLDAFTAIVRRFQAMAHGYAYARLGDFHRAEDVAQDAFVEAYLHLADLREPAAFAGWFRRIIAKHADRAVRVGRHYTPLGDEGLVEGSTPSPAVFAETQQTTELVLSAIRGLPVHQRTATTLFYIDGYSQVEVAEFLDVPVTTVKKRLHDARKGLKKGLFDMAGDFLKNLPLSDRFAELVVRKAVSLDELSSAAKFLGYNARTNPEHFASLQAAIDAGIFVMGDKGNVDGAGYFSATDLCIGTTVVKAIRPDEMGAESVGVPDPAFVRSYKGCFKLARAQGIALAAIHGSQFDHAFCGFVPCFYYPVANLSCNRAASVETCAEIVEASTEEREEANRAWRSDPYGPRMSAYIGGGTPHTVRQDGKTVGYVAMNREFRPEKHYDMPFGYIPNVWVETREAALAVIKLAGELASENGDTDVTFMQSHMTLLTQTVLNLGGAYVLRPPCDFPGLDSEMVAIVDFACLMTQLRDEFASRLRASTARDVDGAFSIQLEEATVGFEVRDGHLEVVTERQNVHAVLPRWLVTKNTGQSRSRHETVGTVRPGSGDFAGIFPEAVAHSHAGSRCLAMGPGKRTSPL
jgi:RNA polymerase sigma factor (sigma-70 family)